MVRVVTCVAVVAFVVAFAIPALVVADDDWRHVLQSEGVDVYERDAQWLGDTAFSGVTRVDMPIDEVVPVFVDSDEREHWVYRFGEQQMLDTEEPNQEWSERYWVRVDMPFPATDRDYVFHTDYELQPEARRVVATLRSVDDPRMPERDCCVRAESITQYHIEALPGPDGEERTEIRVAVETDLGGALPGWITEQAQREWPVETLTALVDRAAEAGLAPDERLENWHAPEEFDPVGRLVSLSAQTPSTVSPFGLRGAACHSSAANDSWSPPQAKSKSPSGGVSDESVVDAVFVVDDVDGGKGIDVVALGDGVGAEIDRKVDVFFVDVVGDLVGALVVESDTDDVELVVAFGSVVERGDGP